LTDKNPSSAKLKALEGAINQIQKDYGAESIMDMSGGVKDIESISTEAISLDVALGIGGIPKGRIIEIFGPESSGKTTLCYHLMADVQKNGGIAAFIDVEHAMDAQYAAKVGVDVDKLVISQPTYGEEALSIAELLTDSGAVDLIVVDSVAALVPKAELEGNIADSQMGLQARMMSKACRMLSGKANKSKTTIVFTNQIREKIGVMFGSPETQPGGRALKYYSSVRLDIRRIETIKDKTVSTANRVRVKVVKNKVAPPFTQAEFDIVFGEGIDKYGILIDYATEDEVGIVKKAGSFFTFPGDHKEQGKAKARDYLESQPELVEEIDAKIREVYLTKSSNEEIVEEQEEQVEQEEKEETDAS
jgi:recombination protein RecA